MDSDVGVSGETDVCLNSVQFLEEVTIRLFHWDALHQTGVFRKFPHGIEGWVALCRQGCDEPDERGASADATVRGSAVGS